MKARAGHQIEMRRRIVSIAIKVALILFSPYVAGGGIYNQIDKPPRRIIVPTRAHSVYNNLGIIFKLVFTRVTNAIIHL